MADISRSYCYQWTLNKIFSMHSCDNTVYYPELILYNSVYHNNFNIITELYNAINYILPVPSNTIKCHGCKNLLFSTWTNNICVHICTKKLVQCGWKQVLCTALFFECAQQPLHKCQSVMVAKSKVIMWEMYTIYLKIMITYRFLMNFYLCISDQPYMLTSSR